MDELEEAAPRNPKGGRPKKADGELRSVRLTLRLTLAEKAAIDAHAAAAGVDVSRYLRGLALKGALPFSAGDDGLRPSPGRSDPALLSELNRIGVNVNQLARAVHRGADFVAYWRAIGAELERALAKVAGRADRS